MSNQIHIEQYRTSTKFKQSKNIYRHQMHHSSHAVQQRCADGEAKLACPSSLKCNRSVQQIKLVCELCLPAVVVASSGEEALPTGSIRAYTELLTPPSALLPPAAGCRAPTPACTGGAAAAFKSASNTSSCSMVIPRSILSLPELKPSHMHVILIG